MKKLKKVLKSPKLNSKETPKLLSHKRKSETNIDDFQCDIKKPKDILSPHNTTQFLIANNSTSFYPEEEDDLDINISLNPLILFDTKNPLLDFDMEIENKNLDSKEIEFASTAPSSHNTSDAK